MKKKILLTICIFIGVLLVIYMFLPSKVAVLGYHNIINYNDESNNMSIFVDKFDKEMKFLKDMGFKSLTLDEMNDYMNGKLKVGKKSVLITFDDGYRSNYEYAFPILKKYNLNAVVFIIGKETLNNNDTYFNKELIEKSKKKYPNIEFASHSFDMHDNHGARIMNYEEILNDFNEQKKVINTKYFAYPYGEYNDNMVNALKKYDYNLAFGFGYNTKFKKAYKTDNKYVIPRLSINSSMPLWKFKLRLFMIN